MGKRLGGGWEEAVDGIASHAYAALYKKRLFVAAI